MSGMPEGTRIQIQDTEDASNLLPIIAPQQLYSFRYMHHKQGWEFRTVAGKGLWMPVMKRYALMPGVDGIREGRGGAVAAVAKRKAAGWTFMELDAPVVTTVNSKLVKSIGYLQTYKTQKKNHPCYSDVWSCPYIIDSKTVDWESHYDYMGHDASLILWMELGLIKAPDFANVSTRIKVQGRRSRRRAKLALTGTPAAVEAKVLEDNKLEAMERAAPKSQGRRATRAANPIDNVDPVAEMQAIVASMTKDDKNVNA